MVSPSKPNKVLLIGWDGADWKVINKLIEEGKMPNTASLIEEGVMGDLSTLQPVLSPMIWTSIATGKYPFKHGVLGFTEPRPDSSGIRPVSNLSRRCRAIWNILHQQGKTSNVIGWWPSHPAEPIRGVMVSNHYHRAVNSIDKPWPLQPGTIHPHRLIEPLANLRLHPQELSAEHIGPFVPNFGKIDQDKDRRLESLAKIIAECSTIHSAATALMQLEPWDFMGVYYDSIDHFSHGFMRYHPPQMDGVSDEDFEIYQDVVESAYRYHDMMLAALLHLAGEDTTVILISDHGFHSDALRPQSIPNEPAGPAVQHRDYGIFAMKGPGVKKDERIYGASVLDITPTILYAMGLPVGDDMDGIPLVNAFTHPADVKHIESWDDVAGEDGTHSAENVSDPIESEEAIRQLIALGYIDKPNDNIQQAIDDTRIELDYNVSRSYMFASRYYEARPILEKLVEKKPAEARFAINLIRCLQNLDQIETARNVMDTMLIHLKDDSQIARQELKTLSEANKDKDADDFTEQEQQQFRKLRARAFLNQQDIANLQGIQLLAEKRYPEALVYFKTLIQKQPGRARLHLQYGETLMQMRQWEGAEEAYQQALKIDSGFVPPRLGLCRCYLHQKRYQEAAGEALNAIGLNYQLPAAHFYLGFSLARLNHVQRAIEALKVATTLNPNYVGALRHLSNIYRRRLRNPELAHDYKTREQEARIRLRAIRKGEFTANEPIARHKRTPISSERDVLDDPSLPRTITTPLEQTTIIVSGLPRSGTSMMMQMLQSAGIEIITDNQRQADDFNKKGYLEDSRVKGLRKDNAWMKEISNSAIKIVIPQLGFIPLDATKHYAIILMERNIDDIVSSQNRMIAETDHQGADISPEKLTKTFRTHLLNTKRFLAMRQIPTLRISYERTLLDPVETAKRINTFLTTGFDPHVMASSVDKSLTTVSGTITETN